MHGFLFSSSIHVRRTDKNLEAAYYSLEKYMKHVENYYMDLEVATPLAPPLPRRVFLATEVPALVEEARRKYDMMKLDFA